ncbi:probable methyltransferase-like protein 15 homolog [Amphibalanus amphitrite]|uniref:probable methyltransferase-like protein 15 homolog n=1 Tax=Amphibalanus amphitrite TaxID=1232801 RepID=UPI001C9171AD|nr:probable methyltransferase-like protein 15 homolog [Amphibalanus amphitrite]
MWCHRAMVRALRPVCRRSSSTAGPATPVEPPPPPAELPPPPAELPPRPHVPVMPAEVCSLLAIRPGDTVIDMTFGAGGHTERLLETVPGLTVYALDRDPSAFARARRLSAEWRGSGRVVPLLGRFSELPRLLTEAGVRPGSVSAAVLDCGCCSTQLEDAGRGFSLARDGPLDMRMDGQRGTDAPTAAQLLAHASEASLARIIRAYGEEPMARKIARAIVEARYMLRPLRTTGELAQLVRAVCQRERRDKLGRPAHAATRTFQALRIFVNDELNQLHAGVAAAHGALRPAGRLAALSFHSLEDRVLKEALLASPLSEEAGRRHRTGRHGAALCAPDPALLPPAQLKRWRPVNRRVLVPSEQEVAHNPRSRSAKLRVAEKCCGEEEL